MLYFSFGGIIILSIAIYLMLSNQAFILENQDKGLNQLDSLEKNVENLTKDFDQLVIDSS